VPRVMPDHERGEFWPPEKSAPSIDLRARAANQATIAVAIMLLAVWVARDFLVALTWAAVIAITCWPDLPCASSGSLAIVRDRWRRCYSRL